MIEPDHEGKITCPICRTRYTPALQRRDDRLIQDQFPEASPAEREELISGTCQECQKRIFVEPGHQMTGTERFMDRQFPDMQTWLEWVYNSEPWTEGKRWKDLPINNLRQEVRDKFHRWHPSDDDHLRSDEREELHNLTLSCLMLAQRLHWQAFPSKPPGSKLAKEIYHYMVESNCVDGCIIEMIDAHMSETENRKCRRENT